MRRQQYSPSNDYWQTPNLVTRSSADRPRGHRATGVESREQHIAGPPFPFRSQLEEWTPPQASAVPQPPVPTGPRRPTPARGRGPDRRAATLPAGAPPLEQGAGPGRGTLAQAKNGAENLSQPSVHSRPEQQRRPTHPETRTPELSPPLPPSPLRP